MNVTASKPPDKIQSQGHEYKLADGSKKDNAKAKTNNANIGGYKTGPSLMSQ